MNQLYNLSELLKKSHRVSRINGIAGMPGMIIPTYERTSVIIPKIK